MSSTPTERVLLSVVIPTCGRVGLLEEALTLLQPRASAMPGLTWETIVTDDSPAAVALRLGEKFPWAKFVQGPGRGPAANRNSGASLARGEWLVFLDDDCRPTPGWLEAVAAATGEDCDLIEGKTVCPDRRDTPFEEQIENLQGGLFWSCNLAVRRRAFLELGGFDEDFLEPCMEDMEFAWRTRHRGLRTHFASDAVVEHPARRITLGQLWRRSLMLRWHSLYRLKTGAAPRLGAPALEVLAACLRNRTLDLLRTCWHTVSRRHPGTLKRTLSLQAWRILTFPAVLAYCAYWELRFRRELTSCPGESTTPPRAAAPAPTA